MLFFLPHWCYMSYETGQNTTIPQPINFRINEKVVVQTRLVFLLFVQDSLTRLYFPRKNFGANFAAGTVQCGSITGANFVVYCLNYGTGKSH